MAGRTFRIPVQTLALTVCQKWEFEKSEGETGIIMTGRAHHSNEGVVPQTFGKARLC